MTAPKVILAVNGHLNSFGFLKGQLMHVFTYASMTRPLTAPEMDRIGRCADLGADACGPDGHNCAPYYGR